MGVRRVCVHDVVMSDQSPPPNEPAGESPTGQLPPPPAQGGPNAPSRIRRSKRDRMIAGVSGGIAEYFRVDPIIPRLGFVATSLLGGTGVVVYLIAWLVMPDETEDESAAVRALRGENRSGHNAGGRSLLALALLFAGIVALSGSALWRSGPGDDLFLPLLIVAAGVALLVWPSDTADRAGAVEVEGEQRSEAATLSGDNPARPPAPTPFLGPLALAALLLFGGITVFADQVGWWTTDPVTFLAVCLVIVGSVLVASAFVGRARGLVWLGLILLPIAWSVAAVDIDWHSGIGERSYEAATLDELEESYELGLGELHVDLSDLELAGETVDLPVGLTVGEIKIWVPETFETVVDIDGRLGSVVIEDGQDRVNNDGGHIDLDRSVGDPAGGTLNLDVDLGIGEATVIVCGPESQRCP